ncbi:MAG: F0F1 ATP synthase subunit B [Clostridia bacterium]|nr:F0F1 ATP synthase subunit B [Clostridia bacterium]
MIQSLDVISVNLWQILISLANLLILFTLVKKFLFGPVKNVMTKRQAEIDEKYTAADVAVDAAEKDKKEWEEKMQGADAKAQDILSSASENAKQRSEKIVLEAKERAESILRQAEAEAELERKKAIDGIKREIVEVSGALTEKMLEREVNTKDHRNLIDSFIEKLGDSDDTDK